MATIDYTPRTIEIQLKHGHVAIIDEQDADLALITWTPKVYENGAVYCVNQIRKRPTLRLHNVVFERVIGRPLSDDEYADHIDRNPLNNRRSNLRLATKMQNNQNVGIQRNNTTGYKGASLNRRTGLYRARITVNSKEKDLGWYHTAEDAASVYNHYAAIHYGEFAYINEIEGWQERALYLIDNPPPRRGNISGYRGVYVYGDRWTARVRINQKEIHLGIFATAEEAHHARAQYLKEHQ
ncbi:MAG: HNH endonuclease [Chloroflexi bacterium]|nr:HNH endonuclease [Chloroflexota bacterium]